MSSTNDDIAGYARLLEHAPVLLRSKSEGVAPAPISEGLSRVGGNAEYERVTFVEAGPDAAQFLAHVIAPFVKAPILDREGLLERLTAGTPPALGDGAEPLTSEEAQRVVDVCEMLRMMPGA